MEIKSLFELENNVTFQQLNRQVNSFNVLKVLRLENYEIRHSNILAWLLDPKENHHLHDYFLRKMLEHLILIEENDANEQNEAIAQLLNHSLSESHVYREVKTDNNRFIDLVVVNQQLKTVIVIENKFYSSEGHNQLNDYLTFVQQTFEDFTIIPIYLTLDGEKPSNQQYFIFTYERIEMILHTILMLYKEQLNDKLYTFIEDYRQLLKERFYPNDEQMMQAIEIYRNHRETIEQLFERTSTMNKQMHVESGYSFEFIAKYQNTIQYIYNHGKNILSYSFEGFIREQFDGEVLNQAHPTRPNFLPPEWHNVEQLSLKDPSYWLGRGIVVWFNKTKDNRLRMTAEVGPLEYEDRLSLLEKLETIGLPIKDISKQEKACYTQFFSQKVDINKWDDLEELTQAMGDLYNSCEFISLRKKLAAALNDENIEEEVIQVVQLANEGKSRIQNGFRNWMETMQIPENNYRVTSRNVSFKIPLFDAFKERLGETREKWWWDNGPFLFWMDIKPDSLYFTLEVGPIVADKRVLLMEKISEKGISFNKRGLNPEAKYTRIYSETVAIEADIEAMYDRLYNHQDLQVILTKLHEIYDEVAHLE